MAHRYMVSVTNIEEAACFFRMNVCKFVLGHCAALVWRAGRCRMIYYHCNTVTMPYYYPLK